MALGSMGMSRKMIVAALAASVAIGGMTPALAQKKKGKEAEPAGLKLSVSKAFQPVAVQAQTAVAAAKADPAQAPAAKTAVDAAFAAATSPDDKFVAGQLAVQLGSQVKEPALQLKGLKAMVESNKTPADNPKYNSFIAALAYDAKDYAAARAAAEAAVQGGYAGDDVYIVLAESYGAQNQPAQALAEFKKAANAKRAAGQPVPEAWIKRAVSMAYKAKLTNEAADWAQMQVDLYPTNFNWLGSAQLVRLVGNYTPNETIDLFRLMWRSGAFDNDPKLVANEYREFVEAADPRRLPGEVVAVIDKGKASGALNGQWVTDARTLAAGRIPADKASLPKQAAAAKTPTDMIAVGDAFLNYGQAAEAEALYQKAAASAAGADKDRALTRLGIAQYDQGKYPAAKASFTQVGGNRAPMAKLWLSLIKTKAPTA